MNELCNYKPESSLLNTRLLFTRYIGINKKGNELITLIAKYVLPEYSTGHKCIFLPAFCSLSIYKEYLFQTKLQTEVLLLKWAVYTFFQEQVLFSYYFMDKYKDVFNLSFVMNLYIYFKRICLPNVWLYRRWL